MTHPAKHIARMAPYALSKFDIPNGKRLISLSQNESMRAPSLMINDAVNRVINNGALYPDPEWTDLRSALAEVHGIDANTILCGTGSLDLIGCIAHVFAGPTRSILAPEHAYPFFRSAAEMTGARFDTAPEKNAVVDVDTLLQNVKPDTGIIFIANPANPTGTRIPKHELQRLRKNLRDDILLVIDEAYGEFADHLNEFTFDMVSENTAVLRTLSKAYGMAGFRVGWGVFAPTIRAELQKVMNPNNISCLSQAAAVAAIADQAYMRETCERTAEMAAAATHELSSLGFKVYESFTNFILIDLKTADHAISAETMLLSEGVVLRRQAGAGLPHCLRMTLGQQEDVSFAIEILKKWKQENPDA